MVGRKCTHLIGYKNVGKQHQLSQPACDVRSRACERNNSSNCLAQNSAMCREVLSHAACPFPISNEKAAM
jgi:hypothetical protein